LDTPCRCLRQNQPGQNIMDFRREETGELGELTDELKGKLDGFRDGDGWCEAKICVSGKPGELKAFG